MILFFFIFKILIKGSPRIKRYPALARQLGIIDPGPDMWSAGLVNRFPPEMIGRFPGHPAEKNIKV